eukprot:scaffold151204_cov31-Tisochrysis_lutea.AAC.3
MIRLLECGEVRTRLASAAALANLCLDSTIVSLVLDGGAAAYFIRILSEDRKGACAGDNFIQVDRPQEFDALRVAAARAVCNIVGTTDDMWVSCRSASCGYRLSFSRSCPQMDEHVFGVLV